MKEKTVKSLVKTLTLAAAVAIFGTLVMPSVSAAGDRCANAARRDACIAFLRAELATERAKNRKAVTQERTAAIQVIRVPRMIKKPAKRVTQMAAVSGKVSWYVEVKRKQDACSVVLYEGRYRGTGAATNVIQTWDGNGWFKRGGRWYKKVTISAATLNQYNVVTMCSCNGHNTFRRNDIMTVLSQRNVGLGDTAKMFSRGGF